MTIAPRVWWGVWLLYVAAWSVALLTPHPVQIRDALLASEVPSIEVHVSNVHKREEFRHHSVIADVVVGRIMGFGDRGYDH